MSSSAKEQYSLADVKYCSRNIFEATLSGDFPLVVLLWGMVNASNQNPLLVPAAEPAVGGNSLLHYAALGGQIDIMQFYIQQAQLVQSHHLINQPNSAGETPLIRASSRGNLSVVKALVDMGGANLLQKDQNGNTAAHHAAFNGHLWVLHYLLEKQVANDQADDQLEITYGGLCNKKKTVLHWACISENYVIISYLLKRGFDPDLSDSEGKTCLHYAILENKKKIIDLLLYHGANSEVTDDRGLTAKSTARHFNRRTISNMLLCVNSKDKLEKDSDFTKQTPTRFFVLLLYSLLIVLFLASTIVIPWYVVIPCVSTLYYISNCRCYGHHHQSSKCSSSSKKDNSMTADDLLPRLLVCRSQIVRDSIKSNFCHLSLKWLTSQAEIYAGVWFGWVFSYFLLTCLIMNGYLYGSVWNKFKYLVILSIIWSVLTVLLWVRLAISPKLPGKIRTSESDFDELLKYASQGIKPDPKSNCTSCMIVKPLRSKHCSVCGTCIAKMDHHCVWINCCVGFGNHKLFIVFLFIHIVSVVHFMALLILILRESVTVSQKKGICEFISNILQEFLPCTILLTWSIITTMGLTLILFRQIYNIASNCTENESINWQRYDYISKTEGQILLDRDSNKFNKGIPRNLKQFIGLKSYYINYYNANDTKLAVADNETVDKKV